MNPDQKKYILENRSKKSPEQIASDSGIKLRKVKKFLDGQKSEPLIKQDTCKCKIAGIPYSAFFILFLAGLLVYSNTFFGTFHFDDLESIFYNPSIRNLSDLHVIWNYWPTRFVTQLSFAFNYHFCNLNVFGYHLVNFIIHLGTAFLVWRLVFLTFSTPLMRDQKISQHAQHIAFFAGLLFIVHPIQTQAVTYIVQRATSFTTFFYLASLTLYVQARLSGKKDIWKLYYAGSLVTAILAMFTKEMAITLPFMVLSYECFFLKVEKGINWKKLMPIMATLLIIPLTMALTRSVDFTEMKRVVEVPTNISLSQYLLTQFRVFVTYIRLLFVPINQNLDYDYPLVKTFFELPVLASLLLLISILAASIKMRPKYPLLSFGIFWFFITLLPESSIIPIKEVVNEHRLYLPMAGYVLFLTAGMFYLFQKRSVRFIVVILSLLALCYGVKAYNRNGVWKDELSLWSDVVSKSPRKERGLNFFGGALQAKGELDQAISAYSRAIEINPKSLNVYTNRGTAYQAKGDFDRAISDYNEALLVHPDDPEVYFNRGSVYQAQGDLDRAISDYTLAMENRLDYDAAYFGLANAWKDKGDLDKAISFYGKAIEKKPNHTGAYNNRAVAYFLTKQYAKSWEDVRKLRSLGGDINPGILEKLKVASGMER